MNLKPIIKHLLKKILTLKIMKTSNKLLIALAISLIIIPIIVIAIDVKMNYSDKKTFFKHLKENNNFNAPLEGFERKEMPAFSEIDIEDGNNAYINFNIIKSDKSGIKIPVELSQLYDFSVDNNQRLQIKLKQASQKMKNSFTIYVYSNSVKMLSVAKAGGFTLAVSVDSLTMIAKDINRLSFEGSSNVRGLKLTADKVKDLSFFDSKGIKNVNLDLNESNISTSKSLFQSLRINSSGKSDIEIYGDKGHQSKYEIGFLSIQTTGKSNLKLEDLIVHQSSGSLSDSTKVNMPVYILKTMFKN